MSYLKIKKNYKLIHKEISQSQQGKKKTIIIAVTKKQPQKTIEEAYKNKIIDFGENQVKEAKTKFENLNFRNKITLHLIGHLQSNKAKKAVEIFDVIQTVDSIKIAEKINKEAQKIHKKQKIFVQVNISRDKKKFGFLKHEVEKNIKNIQKYQFIKPIGIMVITKQTKEEKKTKEYFQETKKIQKKIQKIDPRYVNISMGMSKDYLLAVNEGATHVRIGTAIFGARKE